VKALELPGTYDDFGEMAGIKEQASMIVRYDFDCWQWVPLLRFNTLDELPQGLITFVVCRLHRLNKRAKHDLLGNGALNAP